jgi:Domain of unknown function (DUF3883)
MTGPKLPLQTLFLHIGWAREYKGAPDDLPVGKFGFIKEHAGEAAWESRNFQVFKKRCFGYAPVGHGAVDLTRLGGERGDTYVDGVLVVWTATDPDQGGRYIVGWYRHAKVYAQMQRRNDRAAFVVETVAEDCHLVRDDQRSFFIPAHKSGWPGIASAFFASDVLSPTSLAKVLAYVNGSPSQGFFEPDKTPPPSPDEEWPTQDPELRTKVEKAAMDVVVAHYRKEGFTVQSVEKENLGWDLNVTKSGRLFRVEVKGRAGCGAVELTPNEYAAMQDKKIRLSYRLAIVQNALSESPVLTLFHYEPVSETWKSALDATLSLRKKVGAIATFL